MNWIVDTCVLIDILEADPAFGVKSARRPVADILIGAFASNRRGLITRNGPDFARWYPGMTIIEPD